ncbi:MAG: hypothetical protein FWF00_01545 [Endomicrobia bacterium]|nr:hypothetical protein [Endomicrobiia bacterium]MCL2506360.1 hypothetical protein [Endomicrobiia bacterium]
MKKYTVLFLALAFILFSGGVSFAEKRPVNLNSEEDIADLRKDAERGDRGAQYELSMVYTIKQDGKEALKWLTKSAENGFGKAQYTLGNLYYSGSKVVEKDYIAALKWFSASKETSYKGRSVDDLIESSKQKIEEQKRIIEANRKAAEAKKIAAEEARKKAAAEAKRKAAEEAEEKEKERLAAEAAVSVEILEIPGEESDDISVQQSAKTEVKSFLQKMKEKVLK